MNIKVFQVRKYQMGMKLVDIGRFLVMQILVNNDLMVLECLLGSLLHFQKNQVLVFDEMHLINKLLDEYRDEQFRCCEDIQLLPRPENTLVGAKNKTSTYLIEIKHDSGLAIIFRINQFLEE